MSNKLTKCFDSDDWKEYNHKRYEKYKKSRLEYQRKYYLAHKEEIKKRNRNYYKIKCGLRIGK